jgi:hypothetical protein
MEDEEEDGRRMMTMVVMKYFNCGEGGGSFV